MRIAVLCSSHGFGHLGRQLALVEELLARGHAVDVHTAAPAVVRADQPAAGVVDTRLDVGIVQADALHEDEAATRIAADAALDPARVEAVAATLAGVDLVVCDIPAVGFAAARRAGVPCVGVGNFDWPWIYGHYPRLAPLVPRLRALQGDAPMAVVTPAVPFAPPGAPVFGVLGRRRPPVRVAERAVLVSFGGLGLGGVDALIPRIDGVTWVMAPPMPALDRPDVRWAPGVGYASLVAGADLVLSKPGYGIYAECALAGTPLVWLDRGAFPEASVLEAAMWARGDHKVGPDGLAAAVRARLAGPRPAPVAPDTAARLADWALAHAGARAAEARP